MVFVGTEKAEVVRFTLVIRCALLGAFLCLPASAVNPDRRISQYAHSAWRILDGSLGGTPRSITQTADGYIMDRAESGIVRFDGVRFIPWTSPGAERLGASSVSALLGSSDGSLWIGSVRNGLWHWNNGRLTPYPTPAHVMSINSVQEEGKESIWFAVTEPRDQAGSVCEVGEGQFRCYGQPSGIPPRCCHSLAVDRTGDSWMGAATTIVKWKPRSSTATIISLSDAVADPTDVLGFAFPADDSASIGIDPPGRMGGLKRFFHGVLSPYTTTGWSSSNIGVITMLQDRQGTIWIGTSGQGLYRIRDGAVDHVGAAEGLSADHVTNIMEDHEG